MIDSWRERAVWFASPMVLAAACACLAWTLPTSAMSAARAEAPPAQSAIQRTQDALARLAADEYYVRAAAAADLERLASESPEHAAEIAALCQESLESPTASLELRIVLDGFLSRLPPATPMPLEATDEELAAWIAELEAPTYGERAAATAKLNRLSLQPGGAARVAERLKRRLADLSLPNSSRSLFEPLWADARLKWLVSDPSFWQLPPVSDETISKWLDDYQRPPGETETAIDVRRRAIAEIELYDLLARDEYVEPVKRLLSDRMQKADLESDVKSRLAELSDWLQPAMVAEIWNSGRHATIQHLLIGVPARPDGSMRETWFDRIDEKTAHCVSGNTLDPGDYPVGVMFSYQGQIDIMQFHIVNVPTPRRRLRHQCYVKTSEYERFNVISRNTVAHYLEQKQPLDEFEFITLASLDQGAVSRFAGSFMLAVDDQPYRANSQHGRLCELLAESGTFEALPGLLEAIEKRRLLLTKPADVNPAWQAIFAICLRDPWPGCDDVLAGLIERQEPLFNNDGEEASAGATAAACLLKLKGKSPAEFGLQAVYPKLDNLELSIMGYQFTSPDGIEMVREWWDSQKKESQDSVPPFDVKDARAMN